MRAVIASTILLACVNASAQPTTENLSVESYTRLVLENSPEVRQAGDILAQADALYKSQLSAAILPTLAVTGQATPYGHDPLDSNRFHTLRLKRTAMNFNTTVSWNLFNGLQDFQKVRASSFSRNAAEKSLEAARQERAHEAINAFYDLSSKSQLLEVARQNLSAQEEQFRQTADLYRNGMKSLSDMLKGETDWRSSELRLLSAQADYKTALAQYNTLINRKPLEPAELKTSLGPGATTLPLIDEDTSRALSRRPEVLRARSEWEKSRVALEQAVQGIVPNLSMNATWTRSYLGPPSNTTNPNHQIGLSLTLPVQFNIVSQAYSYLGAKAETRRSAGALEAVTRRVKHDSSKAYIRVERAILTYQVSLQKEALSQRNLALVKDQYRQGSADAIRLAQAQIDFLNSQVERTQALHDIHTSRAQYKFAIGEPLW